MAEFDTSYIRKTEDGEQVEYTGTTFSAINIIKDKGLTKYKAINASFCM